MGVIGTVLVCAGLLLLMLGDPPRGLRPRPSSTPHDRPAPPQGPGSTSRPRQETTMSSRLFHLERDTDVSGVSGTGVVAEGVAFSDGTAVIHWVAGVHRSTVVWPDVAGVEAIHGHGGATRIVWADQ